MDGVDGLDGQQQGVDTTGTPIAAAEFAARGLTGGTDMWSAGNYSTEQILAAFRRFDDIRAKGPIPNPPGLFRTLLEGGVAEPLGKAVKVVEAKPLRVRTAEDEAADEARALAMTEADKKFKAERLKKFPEPAVNGKENARAVK
jgi:hypothetical protein